MKKKLSVAIMLIVVLAVAVVAFTACNGEDQCTVVFSGEGITLSQQTVKKGSTVTEPETPTREGYEFVGWMKDGEKFDFSTPIEENIFLKAEWKKIKPDEPTDPSKPDQPDKPDEPDKKGTKNNPYIIASADDLLDFADRLNNLDEEGNAEYNESFFRLDADIDMEGKRFSPIAPIKTYNEDEDDEWTSEGFKGNFDGNGHKISNIALTSLLRSKNTTYYVGFFSATKKANIHDLTLENIYYEIEAYTDEAKVCYGGVTGYSLLTNYRNVTVTGTLETRLMEKNSAVIGGIAGYVDVYERNNSYIAYAENCLSNVVVKTGQFEDGEKCSLQSAVNGGLFGEISAMNGAFAVINCVSNGKVDGGQYVGGLVGYIAYDRVSIINCANYADVKATNKEVYYVGGLVGYANCDVTVMDSFAQCTITGVRTTSTAYKPYAGGIGGYLKKDDYELYYNAGAAVVNCHFDCKFVSTSGSVRPSFGTKEAVGFDFSEEWAKNTLKWTDGMKFVDGKAVPARLASDGERTYKVTYVSNGNVVKEVESKFTEEEFGLVGTEDALQNNGDGILFYAWELADGVRTRYYVPVVKDITVNAKWHDATEICGVYAGTSRYVETKEAGVIVFSKDGTLSWTLAGGTVSGTFTYDGTHIDMVFHSAKGDVTGKVENGQIVFNVEETASATVTYTFAKSDITVFGDYYNDNGDIITIDGTNINLHVYGLNKSNRISGKIEFAEDGMSGTVKSGKLLDEFYQSINFTVNEDYSLTVTALKKSAQAPEYESLTFAKKATPDYTGKNFIGSFYMVKPESDSMENPSKTAYTMVFDKNGTVTKKSRYSDTIGAFVTFKNDTVMKFTLEGYVSTLFYDEEKQVWYGEVSYGTYTQTVTVLIPEAKGEPKAVIYEADLSTIIYVAGSDLYYFKNGVYTDVSGIEAANNFAEGERVTVDGVDCRVVCYEDRGVTGYKVCVIGKEEGTYTCGENTVTFDGLGKVSGTKTGTYHVYDATVVVVFDDDTFYGFDYKIAKANNDVATLIAPSKYQGVWYQGKTVDVKNENADVIGHEYVERYYKFMLDGYGHTALMYYSTDEQRYKYNWGGTNGWVEAKETDTGIHADYNSYQSADVLFYYGMQLAYSKKFGYMGETAFAKAGYDGELTPPSIPTDTAGSYVGTESDGTAVVLNLKNDLSGSYKGVPFAAIYDGEKLVMFTIDDVRYAFDIQTKTLTYAAETVTLTRTGEVTEIIPSSFCGTWSGEFTGYGTSSGEIRSITIEASGKITYGDVEIMATYDVEKQIISGNNFDESGFGYKITLVWNAEKHTFAATIDNIRDASGGVTVNCSSLSKNAD